MAVKNIPTKLYKSAIKEVGKARKRESKEINLEVAPLLNSLSEAIVIAKEVAFSFLIKLVNTFSEHTNSISNVCNSNSIPKIMATYYPQYQLQPNYSFPITMTEWSTVINTVQTPVYSSPVSVPILLTPPQVVTQICPYTGVLVAEPVLSSIIPSPIVTELVPVSNAYKQVVSYSPDQVNNDHTSTKVEAINEQAYHINEAVNQNATEEVHEDVQVDPVEFYLKLPKELFPTARMFCLDPNPMIDEFCKLVNINDNTSWILDLEFGIPRAPVTRAIPVYDVQFNSVHCKNTPGAIHPGFESCSYDFKRVFLFYYDCIISAWYKGYIIMNYDKSVKNFQSWLLVPMQIFGMCWP